MNARRMLLVGALVAISLTMSGVAVAGPWPPHPIHPPHPVFPPHPHYPHPVVSPIIIVRPPVIVRPVVVVNPPAFVPTSIRIVNPATTGATLSYTLNGQQFGLQPGSMEEVGTISVIEFDRGNGLGIARYTLDGGTYTFTAGSNGGWNLVRTLG